MNNPDYKLRFPNSGFTFKPVIAKRPSKPTNVVRVANKILYCKAVKTEDGWKAHVNTRYLQGFKDVTILDFTEKSFDIVGVNNVFYNERDKHGHWTRIIRSDVEADHFPGNKETYCTLCDGCIFSGYIVNVNGKQQFDMSIYQGTDNQCGHLLE